MRAPTPLDVESCRAQFPALAPAAAQGWAFMDNAGGSLAPAQTSDAVARYMRERHVQVGASYALSAAATAEVQAGHAAAARLVGADPDEIALGPSTTMNVYVLAQALRATWGSDAAIVVTDLDHEANGGAWRRLEATGVEVRERKLDIESAELRAEALRPLLDDGKVKLVCFTHCSNVVGTIHDVAALTEVCHAAGAQVCVDGVAYAPHRKIDVRALNVDWYLVSLYKVYGPHVGLLYGKREAFLEARNQNHFFYSEEQVPHKLMPGNVSHELAAGVSGALRYLDTVAPRLEDAFDAFAAHEAEIVRPLLSYLRDRRGVRVLGRTDSDPAHRVPTVAFVVDGLHSSAVPAALDEAKVAVRWGDFYAARAIDALGLRERGGVVRASLVHYNTAEEVSRLIEGLDTVLASLTVSS